jgi:excisionase family DNA binding protein
MKKEFYLTIPELAKILGMSRIAVFKKVKSGEIPAIRVGRNYAIPKKFINNILGRPLSDEEKAQIDIAVKKVVTEYGEVLRLLGRE